jgi:hypothetical protein
MIVYILEDVGDYYSSVIIGVFSSADNAEIAKLKQDPDSVYEINEYELDHIE